MSLQEPKHKVSYSFNRHRYRQTKHLLLFSQAVSFSFPYSLSAGEADTRFEGHSAVMALSSVGCVPEVVVELVLYLRPNDQLRAPQGHMSAQVEKRRCGAAAHISAAAVGNRKPAGLLICFPKILCTDQHTGHHTTLHKETAFYAPGEACKHRQFYRFLFAPRQQVTVVLATGTGPECVTAVRDAGTKTQAGRKHVEPFTANGEKRRGFNIGIARLQAGHTAPSDTDLGHQTYAFLPGLRCGGSGNEEQ